MSSCSRRRDLDDLLHPELGAGDLPIVGGRILSRSLIVGAGVLLASHGFGGAALPIARARKRDRIADARRDPGKVRLRGGGVVEKPQRDPAGSELVLDPVVLPARDRRVARDLIGSLGVIIVDEAVYALQDLQPGLEKVYFTLQEELIKATAQIKFSPGDRIDDIVRQPVIPAGKQQIAEVLLTSVKLPPTWSVQDLVAPVGVKVSRATGSQCVVGRLADAVTA